MAAGRDQHQETTGLVSMHELLDQIDTNKKHFMRACKSDPELLRTIASGSPLARSVLTDLPPVRELDNDPDTFLFLCLPISVITLQGLRRRIWSCISNLLWQRPPLPCVTTTCKPIHHVRSCEFHPLKGALPYKMPIRRTTSLPSVKVQRPASPPDNLCSPTSSSAPSSSTSLPPVKVQRPASPPDNLCSSSSSSAPSSSTSSSTSSSAGS